MGRTVFKTVTFANYRFVYPKINFMNLAHIVGSGRLKQYFM